MDELPQLIKVLADYPEKRRAVLKHLAKRAKADLHDIPPFKETKTWQSFAEAFAQELNPPDWRLDLGEGPDGAAGLENFLVGCEHKKADRWRTAARQLRLCLLYADDAENMSDRAIINVIVAAMDCERQVGRKRRRQVKQFGAARWSDRPPAEEKREPFKLRDRELQANRRLSKHAREKIIASEMNVSRSTVRRRLDE